MKFTESLDGIKRANIKVEYRMTKEEMATALTLEVDTWYAGRDVPDEMGVREVMKHIHNALRYYGEDTLWGKEPDEERLEWAKAQIDRLFPDV